MVLHTFAKGLNQRPLMEKCLSLVRAKDVILLIEDGVVWASPGPLASMVTSSNIQVFCLSEDAQARGIDSFQPGIMVVDYEGLVDLVVKSNTSIAWF